MHHQLFLNTDIFKLLFSCNLHAPCTETVRTQKIKANVITNGCFILEDFWAICYCVCRVLLFY